MPWTRVVWYAVFGLWVVALTFGTPALGRRYISDDKAGEWAAWGIGFVLSIVAVVLVERVLRCRAEPGAAPDPTRDTGSGRL